MNIDAEIDEEKEEKEDTKTSKTTKKEKKSKRVYIDLDKTYEDVIQYQDEGYSVFFADGEGEFLELTPNQQKELNPYNKEKYRIAEAITNKALDLSGIKTSHMKFKPKATYASATNRMRVENKKPGKHYAWKRQDELQQVIYDGGSICQDPEVKTFGAFDVRGKAVTEKDSTHYVQADGVIEQVLTEMSKEIHQAHRDAIDLKSVRQNEAVDNTARAEIDALGGNTAVVDAHFKK